MIDFSEFTNIICDFHRQKWLKDSTVSAAGTAVGLEGSLLLLKVDVAGAAESQGIP